MADAPMKRCEDCKGSGAVWVSRRENDACQVCKGTGEVPAGCFHCEAPATVFDEADKRWLCAPCKGETDAERARELEAYRAGRPATQPELRAMPMRELVATDPEHVLGDRNGAGL